MCFPTGETARVRCRLALMFSVLLVPMLGQELPPAVPDEAAAQPAAEYGGPAILSRGEAPSTRARSGLPLRFFASLFAFREVGLTPLAVEGGRPVNLDYSGMGLGLGVSTYHVFRKAQLGVSYVGSFQHSFNGGRYDTSSHYLTLHYSREITRRIELGTWLGAGYSNRGGLGVNTGLFFDPSLLPDIGVDPFDTRTLMLNGGVRATFQKSARLSFSASAAAIVAKRFSNGLANARGTIVGGDITYRLTRFTSVGVNYSFSHLYFPRSFGGSDIHMVSVFLARRLSRSWEFSGGIGGNRVETLLLRRVPLDPLVALLTGQSQGIAAYYGLNYAGVANARLNRSFRHASLTFSYVQGATPGNAFMLTAQEKTGSVSYGYTGIRKWSLGALIVAGKLRAFTNPATMTRYTAGVGASRRLFDTALNAAFHADVRRYELQNFRRDSYRLQFSLAWSPGEMPLALW